MLIYCINENYELDFVFNRHWQIWRSLVFVIDTNEMKIFVHTCYSQGLISTVSDVFLALTGEVFIFQLRVVVFRVEDKPIMIWKGAEAERKDEEMFSFVQVYWPVTTTVDCTDNDNCQPPSFVMTRSFHCWIYCI